MAEIGCLVNYDPVCMLDPGINPPYSNSSEEEQPRNSTLGCSEHLGCVNMAVKHIVVPMGVIDVLHKHVGVHSYGDAYQTLHMHLSFG